MSQSIDPITHKPIYTPPPPPPPPGQALPPPTTTGAPGFLFETSGATA